MWCRFMSWGVVFSAALFASASAGRAQVQFGQIDTFSDGATQGWAEGPPSSNPPQVQLTGGPAGAGDAWLQNISTGTGTEGSRQVMFNRAQWAGNYNAAGVSRITADVANFGPTTLYVRVGVESSLLGSAWWVSRSAVVLPAGSGWRAASFDLTADAMNDLTNGTLGLPAVLNGVGTLRLFSAQSGATFLGDRIAGVLGVDNIRATAVPEPATAGLLLAAAAFAAGRRRRGG